MQLVFSQDALIASFLERNLGVTIHPPFTSLGFADDAGHLLGAAMFNGYNSHNIELTVFGPGAVSRGSIRAIFSYAFDQLGVIRMTARTRRSNKLVCRLLPRLGFTYEATMKNYFGPTKGDDAIIYRITRQDAAKWLEK